MAMSRLWKTARGFVSHGAVSAGLSGLATATGAGMLGKSSQVVGSAVEVASVSNVVGLGTIGAILGFFEQDHHLFKTPENLTDFAFWGKMMVMIGAKTLAAYIGNLMIQNGENPNNLSASEAAASNLLGSLVLTAGSLGMYGLYRRCSSSRTNEANVSQQFSSTLRV